MAKDSVVCPAIRVWRELMGHWRPHLHEIYSLESQYARMLQSAETDSQDDKLNLDRSTLWSRDKQTQRKFADLLDDLKSDRQTVLHHCESTFTMLMATMSLMESEKAINEAEEVTKLTELAFFFIPLTFVAGIYGMNLGVCGVWRYLKAVINALQAFSPTGPSVWSWAVTSVGLSCITYIVLYYQAIMRFVRTQRSKRRSLAKYGSASER